MSEPGASYAVSDLVAYLTGRWSVERVIEDRSGNAVGRFDGVLDCFPADSALTMREHGELAWAGAHRPAFRTTLLLVPDDPGVGELRFDDGRFFHDLDLRTGRWETTHRCAPDSYAGGFAVRDRTAWAYEWRVTGPRKDLRLTTRLTRNSQYSR